jgi:hypothetical protein
MLVLTDMKKVFLIYILLTFQTYNKLQAQQASNWFFPIGAGIRFQNENVTPLSGGKIIDSDAQRPRESSACISDEWGNLLFYTDGNTIYNKFHQAMPNGENLLGGPSATQVVSIVPIPGDDSKYYVFTIDDFQGLLRNGLRYTIVDICLNEGLGDVDLASKNVLLTDFVAEKQAICKHANGKDYWLLVHKFNSDQFYLYQITETGISSPIIKSIGSKHATTGLNAALFEGCTAAIGQMKFSPEANKIALTNSNTDNPLFEVFSFDNSTGAIDSFSNLSTILTSNIHYQPLPNGILQGYGVSFSPDSKKLYFTLNQGGVSVLAQLHQEAGKWKFGYSYSIPLNIAQLPKLQGMQIAPDGKIYIVQSDYFLASIDKPNETGKNCDIKLNAIGLGISRGSWGLPTFDDGFKYTNKQATCTQSWLFDGEDDCTPFPTIVTKQIKIESRKTIKKVSIYDTGGRLCKEMEDVDVNKVTVIVDDLAQGQYLVITKYTDNTKCISRFNKITAN